MGKPNPPRKPVVAGLTASIDSIAGLEINLKNMSAMIINNAIPRFLLFDFL